MIKSRIGTADSDLRTYTQADMPRIYVPERRRRPLFDFVHKAINHMAALLIKHITNSLSHIIGPR